MAAMCRTEFGRQGTAHGWGGLPVKAIGAHAPRDCDPLSLLVHAAAVSALTHLSGSLTSLCLDGFSSEYPCMVEATPRRLAGVLKQLTCKPLDTGATASGMSSQPSVSPLLCPSLITQHNLHVLVDNPEQRWRGGGVKRALWYTWGCLRAAKLVLAQLE